MNCDSCGATALYVGAYEAGNRDWPYMRVWRCHVCSAHSARLVKELTEEERCRMQLASLEDSPEEEIEILCFMQEIVLKGGRYFYSMLIPLFNISESTKMGESVTTLPSGKELVVTIREGTHE